MAKYREIPELSRQQVEQALLSTDAEAAGIAVLSASLYSDDPAWIEALCVRASSHPDANVKGNAVLGFGHVARRFRHFIEAQTALKIIDAALKDSRYDVRGQAESAADDIETFTDYKL
jgi:hypothetical protein